VGHKTDDFGHADNKSCVFRGLPKGPLILVLTANPDSARTPSCAIHRRTSCRPGYGPRSPGIWLPLPTSRTTVVMRPPRPFESVAQIGDLHRDLRKNRLNILPSSTNRTRSRSPQVATRLTGGVTVALSTLKFVGLHSDSRRGLCKKRFNAGQLPPQGERLRA
jgi:hypothetical protein